MASIFALMWYMLWMMVFATMTVVGSETFGSKAYLLLGHVLFVTSDVVFIGCNSMRPVTSVQFTTISPAPGLEQVLIEYVLSEFIIKLVDAYVQTYRKFYKHLFQQKN